MLAGLFQKLLIINQKYLISAIVSATLTVISIYLFYVAYRPYIIFLLFLYYASTLPIILNRDTLTITLPSYFAPPPPP